MFRICSGLIIIIAILLVGCTDELENKKESSVMQSMEFDHRSVQIKSYEFYVKDSYEFIVIRDEQKEKNIWIMLNPKYPPYYKQIPKINYQISEGILSEIETHKVTKTVVEVLQHHVIESM